jgi:HK97 family phage prohead protease
MNADKKFLRIKLDPADPQLKHSMFPRPRMAVVKHIQESLPEVWALGESQEIFKLWERAENGEESQEIKEFIVDRERHAVRHFGDGMKYCQGDKSEEVVKAILNLLQWGVVGQIGERQAVIALYRYETSEQELPSEEPKSAECVSTDSEDNAGGEGKKEFEEIIDIAMAITNGEPKTEEGEKHIIGVQETDTSVIVEYAKEEATEEETEDGEESEQSFGSNWSETPKANSFIKNCSVQEKKSIPVLDEGEAEEIVKEFKARLDITPTPDIEPIYEGNRIVDYQNVSFRGYASTNEDTTKADRIGDYIRRGAFKKTIRQFKKNPVMLIDHENSVRNIAGSYAKMEEDDKGLLVEGRLSNAPELSTVRALVAEGHLKTLSIGGLFYYEADGKAISQVDLLEVSLVAIPMNPDARFTAVT